MPKVITAEAAKEKALQLGLPFPFTEDEVKGLELPLVKQQQEAYKLLRYLRYNKTHYKTY